MEEVKECNGDDNAVPKSGSVVRRRISGPTRRSTKGGWTEDEDSILALAVEKYNGKNWKKIAANFSNRTDVQCLHRWQKVLDPALIKGYWTKEEDDLIIDLVGKQKGEKKQWSQIAKHLPGRIGKQCRERWHNHLDPRINKTAWTGDEEAILILAHKMYGNKWAEIAKFLHGRTENSIKNHWNCSLKKRMSSRVSCESKNRCSQSNEKDRKFKAAKQSLAKTFSPDQSNNESQSTVSLDLALGPPGNGSDSSQLQLFSNGGEKENNPMEVNSSVSHKHTQELSNFTNSSPPRSVELSNVTDLSPPRSVSLLHTPSNVSGSNRKSSFLTGELKLHCNTRTTSCLHDKNERSRESVKLCYKPPTMEDLKTLLKEPRTTSCLHDKNEGSRESVKLCYKPPTMEDLKTLLKEHRFPSTNSYIRTTASPVSCQTPPSHDGGNFVHFSSAESVLRSAARSFKNTPSIIRKRGLGTCGGQTGSPICSDGASAREESTDKSINNNTNIPQSKRQQNFLSPQKSQKLETSNTTDRSVEKRLEHAFDAVWEDSTNSK